MHDRSQHAECIKLEGLKWYTFKKYNIKYEKLLLKNFKFILASKLNPPSSFTFRCMLTSHYKAIFL